MIAVHILGEWRVPLPVYKRLRLVTIVSLLANVFMLAQHYAP